ncbi:MAG: hypothetical protein M3P14_04570 [Chloroflexota bacterium]|nr:hypothetical protein [Chloroflexota bacterium]
MKDVVFVVAGYGVILGGMAAYAALLLRRLAAVRSTGEAPAVRPKPPANDERE